MVKLAEAMAMTMMREMGTNNDDEYVPMWGRAESKE